MSETKIQVPYGMLKAAMESREKAIGKVGGWSEGMCRPVLEAALLYQREHQPVPTDEQAAEILNKAYADTAGSKAQFQWAAREWIRRMYDAPEPEATDDLSPIKDLIPPMNGFPIANPAHVLMEAYRRGQKGSLK